MLPDTNMFNHNISRNVDIRRAQAPVAAGTDDTQAGLTIDTLGYESVLLAIDFGTITAGAVTDVRLQHGAASDASDMADIAGSKVTVAADQDNLLVLAEVHRPTKRYLRLLTTRATANAVINGGFALLARGATLPPAKHASVSNACKVIASPVSGTA